MLKTFSKKALIATCTAFLLTGCLGQKADSSSPSINPFPITLPNGTSLPPVSGANVVNITVNGSSCTRNYVNKPCATITVCETGSSNCVTVNDILVDTGSYGLRLFKSAVSPLKLSPVLNSSAVPVATCAGFGDGHTDWGPVMSADIVLGGETPVTVPIQVIDADYFAGHYHCGTPDVDPVYYPHGTPAGDFNGILGVGLFAQDCGAECTTNQNKGMYFACSGSTCSGTTLALSSQVTNPVAAESIDNNGLIFELPNVSAMGTTSVNGYMILGIDTRANNVASSRVRTFAADPLTQVPQILTSFNGRSYNSFIDSGSNGLFFPEGAVADCTGANYGWYCPTSQAILSATNSAYNNSTSAAFNFQIIAVDQLLQSPSNWVFPSLGGINSGGFDWGLPFYIGRNIYHGIEGTSSTLGTGPYWAY